MILENIPGYREAVAAAIEEEDSLREFAFTGWPEEICGVSVSQFTLRHLLHLFQIKSPFFYGGDPGPEDVALFLWIVSPQFRLGGDSARGEFYESIAGLGFSAAEQEIRSYIDRAQFDRPSGGGGATPIASFFASVIHTLASEYGWSVSEIMDLPLAAIYQLTRLIAREHNPRRPFPNRISDRAKVEFTKQHLSKNG